MGRRVPKRRGGPVAGARSRASGVGAPRLWVRDERSARGEPGEIRGRPGGSRRRAFRARRARPPRRRISNAPADRVGRILSPTLTATCCCASSSPAMIGCQTLEGRFMMTYGDPLLSSAGNTSPNPSRPAPKCTWSLSVGGAGAGGCMRKLQSPRVRCRGCLGRDGTHRQGI